MTYRIGQGFDVHGYEAGKPLRLGGLTIPNEPGLKGHSDGDVILHALCDALLGAAGLGDIGEHYPDTDNIYKQYDSQLFLSDTLTKVRLSGYKIVNLDVTVIAQKPKLGTLKSDIRHHLAKIVQLDPKLVNIKATTTDGFGFIGREEAMAAMVVVLLELS